jgi:hypothetical protein
MTKTTTERQTMLGFIGADLNDILEMFMMMMMTTMMVVQ